MNTFGRYCIHFSLIGLVILISAIVLMVADGGDMLTPIMLIGISFSELLFIFFMSLLFTYLAKPITLTIKVKDKQSFLEQISIVSEKKWGRKQIQTNEDDIYCYGFVNKYKDWLSTSVKMEFDNNDCYITIPNSYREDIIVISNSDKGMMQKLFKIQ